ncbi:MAG: hypothetical protein MUE54_04035 [Anaerolineae bacterium]|nr:hypothetical protein [Anaerolineae bacterium]
MMSQLSKFILVALFVLWLGAITPAQAQSTCGDLSASDCQLLQTAQEATSALSSANFRAVTDLGFGIEFFPDVIQLRLTTEGAYQRQPYDDVDVDRVFRPLYGLNADMSAILEIIVSEFVSPTDNTFLSSFDLRYVDGMGYAELTKFLTAVDPFARGAGWYSVDMTEYFRRFIQDDVFTANLNEFNTLFGLDYWSVLAFSGAKVARLDDIQADNQSFAVFELTLNVADYLDSNPFVEEPLLEALEDFLLDANVDELSDEALREATQFYLDVLGSIEIRFVQTVGLTDGYVHQTQIDFDFIPDVDSTLSPDPLGLSILADIVLHFSIDFRYTQFNNKIPDIIAPEDSSLVPYDDLFGSGDSSPF